MKLTSKFINVRDLKIARNIINSIILYGECMITEERDNLKSSSMKRKKSKINQRPRK